jgi:glycosyltransferase involved in cell wall biosynthesis
MHNKLVSIVMTTYNGERFIQRQLDSIFAQTYTNFELIICDDRSSDNTFKILEENHNKHGFTLLQNEINLGLVKNFEKVITLAKGDYIVLADQDDIWKKEKVEVLLKSIETHASLFVFSDASELIDENDTIFHHSYYESKNLPDEAIDARVFYLNNPATGCTTLFKKELIQYALPFPNEIKYHDWWLAYVASKYSPVISVKKALIQYRRHDANVTTVEKGEVSKFNFWHKKMEKVRYLDTLHTNRLNHLKAVITFEKKEQFSIKFSQTLLNWHQSYAKNWDTKEYRSFFEANSALYMMPKSIKKAIQGSIGSLKKDKLKIYGDLALQVSAIVIIVIFLLYLMR